MKSTLAVLALAATAASVQAQIIDNLIERASILANAVQFDGGEYVIRNAKTGQYLQFSRPDDTTNVHTTSDYGTVSIAHGSKYGASGLLEGWWSGSIISGMGKCGSAQWGEDSQGIGRDIAFVSYACSVGDDQTGTDTLEVAKQFWRIVPCGSAGGNDDSSSTGPAVVNLNVKGSSDSSSADVQFSNKGSTSSSSSSIAAATATSNKAADDEEDEVDQDLEQEDSVRASPVKLAVASTTRKQEVAAATQSVDPRDRSTWVCRHEGKWLNRHPKYVTEAGHVECKDELEAYRASLKRRSHSSMARKYKRSSSLLQKRATSGRFCIIAEDHLKDMTTRAVGSSTVATYGGYTSQALVDWDASDINQQWDITPA